LVTFPNMLENQIYGAERLCLLRKIESQ
jgi:hypothetical protein